MRFRTNKLGAGQTEKRVKGYKRVGNRNCAGEGAPATREAANEVKCVSAEVPTVPDGCCDVGKEGSTVDGTEVRKKESGAQEKSMNSSK